MVRSAAASHTEEAVMASPGMPATGEASGEGRSGIARVIRLASYGRSLPAVDGSAFLGAGEAIAALGV
jgi:hypothetical protein